jgi:hypothetical protein
MTTDTTTAAVTALRAIREQWGDLLAAIESEPPADWPPVYDRAWEKPAAVDGPQVGRLPLTLREHPAPLNLGALDAACTIERALFELADIIAAAAQHPVATTDLTTMADPFATIVDPVDAADIDRWAYASPTSPGSRRNGLHWCAVWLERTLSGHNPLCRPVGVDAGLIATETIAAAHRVMARALGRDGRDTVAADLCPWCHGTLTMRTTSGDPSDATVTCDTGPTCTAPTDYDGRARRAWTGRDQVGALIVAILHARQRAAA